jgi:zinc protease
VTINAARTAAMKVVTEFAEDGPSDEELARAKGIIAASAVFRRDNQQQLADWYGLMLSSGVPLERIETWDERIAAVTREDVVDVVTRYLIAPHHVDSILLPGRE